MFDSGKTTCAYQPASPPCTSLTVTGISDGIAKRCYFTGKLRECRLLRVELHSALTSPHVGSRPRDTGQSFERIVDEDAAVAAMHTVDGNSDADRAHAATLMIPLYMPMPHMKR